MISDSKLNLKLHRNEDNFCLVTDGTTCKILVEDVRWLVPKLRTHESLRLAYERVLQNSNIAKHPMRRIKIVTRHIAPQSQTIIENPILTGQMPRRVVVAMVDADAFNGTLRKNPFYFEHCFVVQIELRTAGDRFPTNPELFDWGDQQCTVPYVQLMEAYDYAHTDRSMYISYRDYPRGYTVFDFDLTPDNADTGAMQLIRKGDMSLFL